MGNEAQIDVEELLARAQNGSPECLGQLFQYYGNYLKLLAATHIDDKLKTRCSPSDVIQETFCEAHRDFEMFRGNTCAEFLAWLRMILVNNMARELEKHVFAAKRDVRREVSLDAMKNAMEHSAMRLESVLVDQGPSPSSSIHRQERTIALANHLAELPVDYRKVLMYRHCEGLPFKDIAQRLERSEGAVRMLWLRAIEQIRDRLAEKGAL
jgi:RNA polymerase sigma-70 factor (ECF subfamily)